MIKCEILAEIFVIWGTKTYELRQKNRTFSENFQKKKKKKNLKKKFFFLSSSPLFFFSVLFFKKIFLSFEETFFYVMFNKIETPRRSLCSLFLLFCSLFVSFFLSTNNKQNNPRVSFFLSLLFSFIGKNYLKFRI